MEMNSTVLNVNTLKVLACILMATATSFRERERERERELIFYLDGSIMLMMEKLSTGFV